MNNLIRKRGRKWYVDFMYQGVRVREAVGKDKKLALKVANKRLNQLIEGKFFDNLNKQVKTTLKEYSQIYLNEYSKLRNRQSTHKRNIASVKALNKRLGNYQLIQIDLNKVEWYAQQRIKDESSTRPGKKVTGTCANREVYCLSKIYKQAIKQKLVYKNPVKGYEPFRENKRNEYLSIEEVHKFIETARDYIKRFVIIAVTTGLRTSNILNLRWEQINLNTNTISISGSEIKNGEDLTLPIMPLLLNELQKIPKEKQKGYVICRENGQPYKDIRGSFKADLLKAGITRNIRKHDLRHTFGSQSAMAGINAFTLKELMGHKTLETTQRYTHLSIVHKKMEIEKLEIRLNNNETMPETITLKELNILLGQNTTAMKKIKNYLKSKQQSLIPA